MSLNDQMNDDALEAMKLTRKFFVVELNFSPESLTSLDNLFDDVDFSLKGGKSPENIELLTRTWGSYTGEVIRRNLGGEWQVDESAVGGVTLVVNEKTLSPHQEVRDRLADSGALKLADLYDSARG